MAAGASDGRTVVIVPEPKAPRSPGSTLLHVRFHDRLPADAAKAVLLGLPHPLLGALSDAVTETEPVLRRRPSSAR